LVDAVAGNIEAGQPWARQAPGIAVRLSYAEGKQNLMRGAQSDLPSNRLGKSGRFHDEFLVVPALSNLSRS